MTKPDTGVILDLDTLDNGDIDLSPISSLVPSLTSYPNTAPGDLDERLKGQSIVLTNKVILDGATLQRNPHIELICVLATGTNNVDTDAAQARGIPVKNVVAYGTPSVTQHVYSMILALARRLPEYLDAVRKGQWAAQDKFCLLDYPITDLRGKNLGIIGYGELGKGVADAASTFGLNLLIADRPGHAPRAGRTAFEDVITGSDIISLHCPLTAENTGMINREFLQKMKSSAWLINTARGGLVNEADLADALDHGTIAAAALDVLIEEPPKHRSPLLDRHRSNLLITPHIAWAATSARQKIVELTAENIKEFLSTG